MNTFLYKGYMRDEVYPVELALLLTGGRQSDSFVTVGRGAQSQDLATVNNGDARGVVKGDCDPVTASKPRWKVYNTATNNGSSKEYLGQENNDCYKGPYQHGEFAYWESEERYPNNEQIWGELANQKIRHHKFPDELISPRFSTDDQGNNFIYPIGIKIDAQSVYEAIRTSNLSQEEKDEIIGFKIVRGDRSSGNMSVKAKGHFSNVGSYEFEEDSYLFPNYPYNSLFEDPLFATEEIEPGTGYNYPKVRKPFPKGQSIDRFTFHSPDTHFGRVGNVDTGYIKMESIDYGEGKGKFTKIKNNAEYKFLTRNASSAAAALAAAVAFDLKSGKPKFNGSDFAAMYTNMDELFNKLVGYTNFGYNIISIAKFDKTLPVPNSGDKIRSLEYGSYLVDGFNTVEKGKVLNNKLRETSLYLKTNEDFKYAHDYSSFLGTIPKDDSRFIGSFSKRADDIKILSDQDYFNLFSTNYIHSFTAVIMGLLASAEDMSDNDANKKLVILGLLAKVFQDYIENKDLEGLLKLEGAEEDCASQDSPLQIHNLNGAPYTYITKSQFTTVTDAVGEVWGDTTFKDIPDSKGTPEGMSTSNTVSSIKSNENLILKYVIEDLNLDYEQTAAINTLISEDPVASTWSEEQKLMIKIFQATTLYALNQDWEICGGEILSGVFKAFGYAKRYYDSMEEEGLTGNSLNGLRKFDVNAYYGALKAELPSQWGRAYSYELVDTGYYQELDLENPLSEFPTVFGGDTFINKFSFKTKLSVYDYTTVSKIDQADLSLDEKGMLGHPMFWISTKPLSSDFTFNASDVTNSLSGIGATVALRVAGGVAKAIGGVLMSVGAVISLTGVGTVVGLIITAVGGIVSLLGSLFTNKSAPIEKASLRLFKQLINQIIRNLGIKNLNLDMQRDIGLTTLGAIYQYVYGIPTYFVESQVNVDYRQATNDNEGNFFPRVGEDIPEEWLQEDRVPIIHDNKYTYNKTFSKQNRENFYSHLKEDYDFDKDCNTQFPNRAFWSEKTGLEETLDNWLIYKPVSYHDFPKSYGELTSLDGVQNRQVIARFHNKTQIYNALTTINTSTFQAYLGNDRLFKSAPPVDLSETDTGSIGSQHKFLLKTPHGIIFTDSKRGQVILNKGTQVQILSDIGMSKWFDKHLKFKGENIDNNFAGNGVTGVYDEFYDRFLLTKLDGENSWTMSFTFSTQSWTSWHSYLPNYYVGDNDFFHSGIGNTFWDHNLDHSNYTTYYGIKSPYIVEYPFAYDAEDEILQGIQDYTTALIYDEDGETFREPEELIYFNKSVIYNRSQTTGQLNLIPTPQNNLSSYMTYPKYNLDSKDVLVFKKGSYVRFNDIKDIVKVKGGKVILSPLGSSELKLNTSNLNYGRQTFQQPLMRAKDSKVRLILDDRHDVKLLSRVILQQNQESKI